VNPYVVLGIPKEATPEQVKKAYRKKAMKSHPDRGGDVKVFQEVQLAYDVLSDEERRANYDRTGDLGAQADNSFLQVVVILNNTLGACIQECAKGYGKPEEIDLVDWMRRKVQASLDAIRENKGSCKASIDAIMRAQNRFLVKGEAQNVLEDMLAQGKRESEAILEDCKKKEEICLKALAFLKDCRYLFTPAKATMSKWAHIAIQFKTLSGGTSAST
jgi:hypothetical protein